MQKCFVWVTQHFLLIQIKTVVSLGRFILLTNGKYGSSEHAFPHENSLLGLVGTAPFDRWELSTLPQSPPLLIVVLNQHCFCLVP